MKVLFVSNGNVSTGISPIIRNQGESLRRNGVDLDYFPIRGKGLSGYLKNIAPLKNKLKIDRYDLVHGHYSLSSYIATLAGSAPLIVSLMGSDVHAGYFQNQLNRFLNRSRWTRCIVKSQQMYEKLKLKSCIVLPNGVDLDLFRPIDREEARKRTGFEAGMKHILFTASPARWEKNFQLARQAVSLLNDPRVKLHQLEGVAPDEMPFYYSASDVLLLTSFYEGSPNVIKEAMACNVPIVSTDVGDVRWIMGKTEGCYLTGFSADDVARNLEQACAFAWNKGRTNGRERINELGLHSDLVATELIQVYKEVLNHH